MIACDSSGCEPTRGVGERLHAGIIIIIVIIILILIIIIVVIVIVIIVIVVAILILIIVERLHAGEHGLGTRWRHRYRGRP